MSFGLIIEPDAEEDLSEAAIWYEARRPGLGDDFLMAVEATLESVKRNPSHYLFKYRNVQRVLMKRFPYMIYFIVENERIFVLAVIHEKRNPEYHQSRAK